MHSPNDNQQNEIAPLVQANPQSRAVQLWHSFTRLVRTSPASCAAFTLASLFVLLLLLTLIKLFLMKNQNIETTNTHSVTEGDIAITSTAISLGVFFGCGSFFGYRLCTKGLSLNQTTHSNQELNANQNQVAVVHGGVNNV